LLLSEDRFEVVRIDYGIVSIPSFRIDILSSSESVWFGAKITRIESDNKVFFINNGKDCSKSIV